MYAEGTNVAAERSRAEIERMLARFGATGFGYANEGDRSMITFRIGGRVVMIVLGFPAINNPLVARTPSGKLRTQTQAREALDQEIRRRWRSLVLVIKAKLTAVQDGISTLEREFLADLVVPGDGRTFGEWAIPQIEQAYQRNAMPSLVPGGPPPRQLGGGAVDISAARKIHP
jgi:hypothetical protein